MRKLLIIMSLLVISGHAWANTITLETISADSTISVFNNNFSTIANTINGNTEGSSDGGSTVNNIKADSIFEINMGDDANPRLRDSELVGITVDTISGGAASSQGSFVYSGCTPATDSDLTSDVSACTAYINGYRVSKSATSQTYANNTTTYLWLSQAGVYTQSTNPNTSISNSALLASVVTSGGAITTVNDLANRQLPGLVVPVNYRSGLVISRDATTIISVLPGTCEINGAMKTKTSTTPLTLTTAGDWAGGSSLRAADTFGFVGIDTSGNLKMHTTAPAFDNYSLTTTAGKKRYSSWSSTTYRILGWFYMDGGQLVEVASNIKEGDVSNSVTSNDASTVTVTPTADYTFARQKFYSSGGPIKPSIICNWDGRGGADRLSHSISMDNVTVAGTPRFQKQETASTDEQLLYNQGRHVPSQATHTYIAQVRETGGSDIDIENKTFIIEEL